MKTEKLYEADGMLSSFGATVLSCEKRGDGYAVLLDRTAFFPEGGGQTADTGKIGDAHVSDVQIENDEILHFTDAPVAGAVDCTLDFAERFRKMQNHLGEHLLCGAIHRLHGLDNVGFHLGADYMTFDINGVLTEEQIKEAEREANRAVCADVPVRCYYPQPDELRALDYRAKSEKLENVQRIRIVDAEGFDRCACCAPHLDRTGKAGLIKITSAMKYKGGMRFTALCGFDALTDYQRKQDDIAALCALLSSKEELLCETVTARLHELGAAKHTIGLLRRSIVQRTLDSLPEQTKSVCLFEPLLDTNGLRELATGGASKTAGVFAAFSGTDDTGYDFVCTSHHLPMKTLAPKLVSSLGGKCGGSDKMLFGHAEAKKEEILSFFDAFTLDSTFG